MPFTLLHFGPGFLFKAVGSKRISWCAFCAANVMIDIEPLAYWVLRGEPWHRFLHTLPGATLAGILTVGCCKYLLPYWLNWWNRQLSPDQARWLRVEVELNSRALWVGGLLGAWSHLLLDAIMHVDVRPVWPFKNDNPLISVISIDALNLACVVAGIVGLAMLEVSRRRGGKGFRRGD